MPQSPGKAACPSLWKISWPGPFPFHTAPTALQRAGPPEDADRLLRGCAVTQHFPSPNLKMHIRD